MKQNLILIILAMIVAFTETSMLLRIRTLEGRMDKASEALEKTALIITDYDERDLVLHDMIQSNLRLIQKQTLALDLLGSTDAKLFQGVKNNTDAIVKNHYPESPKDQMINKRFRIDLLGGQ